MTTSLAEKYRPTVFQRVRGQPAAVRFLSNLVLKGARGHNLLLYGAIGSGKTTLVQIVAKAFNCLSIDDMGSPCNMCERCLNSESYFFEYDVPKHGGDLASLRAWFEPRDKEPTDGTVRILFLDEVQELAPRAQSMLLKRLDSGRKNVVICAATSERDNLTDAFESRFDDVRIAALSSDEAVMLLEDIAREEGISYVRETFYLLAAVKPCQPRDLISGLGQLASIETPISPDLVERVFGLGYRPLLCGYCSALADGDEVVQNEVWTGWRETASKKIELVKILLTEIFYNDVIGLKTVIDPLAHAFALERMDIARRFCRRLSVTNPRDLEPAFETMLAYWSGTACEAEEDFELKRGLFEVLVNRHLAWHQSAPDGSRMASASVPPHKPEKGPTSIAVQELSAAIGGDNYLDAETAADLVNRASAFIQITGKLFNAALTINPSVDSSRCEQDAIAALKTFANAFGGQFDGDESDFACAMLVDRESYVRGRLVAHLPQADASTFSDKILEWCNKWQDETDDTVSVVLNEGSAKFHWDEVTALCAGAECSDGPGNQRDFREQLRIPRSRWTMPGPVSCAPITYLGRITRPATEAARAYGVGFQPAIELDHVKRLNRNGWELDVHQNRLEEIGRRQSQLLASQKRYADDPDARKKDAERLRQIWGQEPATARAGQQ